MISRATTGAMPTDDTGWAYEMKWDGMRAIAFCDRGELRLASSNGNDATVRFPELAPLAPSLGVNRVILDGEIITFAPDGRPDFGLLQHRMHTSNAVAAAEGAAAQPVVYAVFDILWLDGIDVTSVRGESAAPETSRPDVAHVGASQVRRSHQNAVEHPLHAKFISTTPKISSPKHDLQFHCNFTTNR